MMTGPTDTDSGSTLPSLGHPDNPAYYEALGRAIRVLRTERGMERKDLAQAAGLSYPYVSEIETGKKRASSKALFLIAEALGVRPADLLALGDRYEGQMSSSPEPVAPSPAAAAAAPAPVGGSPYSAASAPVAASPRQPISGAAIPSPAPPAPSQSRAGKWRWFERGEPEPLRSELAAPAHEDGTPRPSERRASPGAAPQAADADDTARRALLEGLADAAEGLSEEDLAALVDLARRLGR